MADASFDALIIGGGVKGLILGMYLARYGNMSVGIFEKRHEAGGGWSTDEAAAPAFLTEHHAASISAAYHSATQLDFPEWRELGGELTTPKVSMSAIFKEDDSSILIYSPKFDRGGELTAKSIAKFSERDAETWLKYQDLYLKVWVPYFMEYTHNPPPPPGEPDALDKLVADPMACIDHSWQHRTPLEAFRDIFENDAFVAFLQKGVHSAMTVASDEPGMALIVLIMAMGIPHARSVIGGTHSWAHAAVKIFLSDGGKIFNEKDVDKVIIENGQAKGITLTDGSRIEARRMVISTLAPHTLCFKLTGKEYYDWRTLRRIENLQQGDSSITWYTWALHELPHYTAANDNPDIDDTWALQILSKDPMELAKVKSRRILGILPGEEELDLMILGHSIVDDRRSPENKHNIMTEQFVLPADAISEDEWLVFKKTHAEDVMNLWSKHAPNMSWDNIIGYIPLTPYDHCRLANLAPSGGWGVIDPGIPSQFGRNRPVPELAGYKTPVKDLYATGSGWPPWGIGASWGGYNCYKVIARDFGLRKPWEEQGRPW